MLDDDTLRNNVLKAMDKHCVALSKNLSKRELENSIRSFDNIMKKALKLKMYNERIIFLTLCESIVNERYKG